MVPLQRWLAALALSVSPAVPAAGDYVGVLRPPAAPTALAIPEPGFYWMPAPLFGGGLGADTATEGFKLKLGYRYSKFLSVETGYADFGSASLRSPFAGLPARGREFSMDTFGTVPLWARAALYGRVGAWRSTGGTSLLSGGDGTQRPGAGLRYGLGFKYDLTRRIGLQAEMEHFSPLDRWGLRDADSDQVSVGVSWRF